MRTKGGLGTELRPEVDRGNYSGRGVLWGWYSGSERAGRQAYVGLVLIGASALTGMMGSRLRPSPPWSAWLVAGLSVVLVVAASSLWAIAARSARRDRRFVAVAYQARGTVRLRDVWTAAAQATAQSEAAGRGSDYQLWLVAGARFTARAEETARRLGYRLFVLGPQGVEELPAQRGDARPQPGPAQVETG